MVSFRKAAGSRPAAMLKINLSYVFLETSSHKHQKMA